MECPECAKTNQKSFAMRQEVKGAAMAFQWCEVAQADIHDPNRYTAHWSCTNGHRFAESYVKPCTYCAFNSYETTTIWSEG